MRVERLIDALKLLLAEGCVLLAPDERMHLLAQSLRENLAELLFGAFGSRHQPGESRRCPLAIGGDSPAPTEHHLRQPFVEKSLEEIGEKFQSRLAREQSWIGPQALRVFGDARGV